jgi:gliding motility-associated-like protein
MYIPDGALIHFGNKNPAGIFGFLRNNGNLSMAQNAQLYFLGKIWMNDTKGNITDGGTTKNSINGGEIHFYQPNPVYGNQGRQILHPGYTDSTLTGPSFSKLTIDNNEGVIITSDMNVLNTINFRRGHVYLNNYNTVLGDSLNLGKITGYDEFKYFVTGSNPSGGYLKYRLVPSGLSGVFPIGPNNKNYAPMQMLNRGNPDAFYARAFEDAYTAANSGPLMKDSTLQLTWQLGKSSLVSGEALVTLQHDMAVEDPVFNANRLGSYVSLYGNNSWDKPFVNPTPQIPGNISSSFSIATAMMNSRKLILSNIPLYVTKRVTKAKKSIIIPNVFSANGDNINDRWIVKGLVEYENCRVEIYNRYGQMIFQSIGYKQPWDGTYKGSPMPVATYYYIINLQPGTKGDKPLSGSVTLLR